jgi:hypothetical protein
VPQDPAYRQRLARSAAGVQPAARGTTARLIVMYSDTTALERYGFIHLAVVCCLPLRYGFKFKFGKVKRVSGARER